MANASPEEMQAGMDAWMGWARGAGPAVADLGAPLDAARHLGEPAPAGPDNVVGYSFLEADSAAAAASILEPHPHLGVDGNSIAILELLAMPGT